MQTVHYAGHECCVLENDQVRLLVTRSVGPRVIFYGFRNGENLFAELPDVVIDCPGSGPFHLYGGHRLWHAPELPSRTYLPDDEPVGISAFDNGLIATQQTEAKTGLQKSIEIRLDPVSARAVLTHRITNHGPGEATFAPWAITQLKTGGTAILPQARIDTGVLPSRSLSLWPYTDMTDPHVQWGSRYILVQAGMRSAFKFGYPNPRGWLAYWLNGTLFVKHAGYDPQAEYYDYGSSSECYCSDRFIELETLAPITTVAPGGEAVHVETWHLYPDIERSQNEGDAQAIAEKLGLA